MQIDIPFTEEKRLIEQAAAQGYASVEAYASELLVQVAQSGARSAFAPLTDEEMEASLAMIERSLAEFEAGKGLTLDQARERTLRRMAQQQQ